MKRLLIGTLSALVIALPLYAQNAPTSTTPSSTSDTTTNPGSMDSSSSKPQMQQDSGSMHKYHKKTKEVEMQEDTSPSSSSGTSMDKAPSSSIDTEAQESEE